MYVPPLTLQSDKSILLRDRQHASRLFVDDQFRLLPKSSFLFHVSFAINPSALTDQEYTQKYRNEINLLVKSVDLPSFNITAETVHQYNRKKVVQVLHKFGEMSMTIHDDNANIMNGLWQNYYKYYYADPTSASSGRSYARNATKAASYLHGSYGLDNGSKIPFFSHITLYQMAQHQYISYKLINPLITHWNHNKVQHSKGEPQEFIVKLMCEAVSYDSGVISATTGPEGFAQDHYDVTPSSLNGTPYGNNNLSPTPLESWQIDRMLALQQQAEMENSGGTESYESDTSLLASFRDKLQSSSSFGAQFPSSTSTKSTTTATASTLTTGK